MKTISIKEHFEDRIEAIWNNPKFSNIEILDYGYAQQNNQVQNSLLFIGINPSNSTMNKEKLFWNDSSHRYFDKFKEISNKLDNTNWSHIDLLFVRETNQNNVKKLVYSKDENILDFILQQLLLAKEMIEMIKPKIIIVNNTLARNLLGFEDGNNWIGYKFSFSNDLGTHFIDNPESPLYKTPVFFTSMLTGQRALDIGSFRRLIWHIDFVSKKIEIGE
jgi:hypothetical protein